MKYCAIVDLDDCLFDSRAMKKYLPVDKHDREQWDEFHKHYNECGINYHILSLLKNYKHKIFFVTSREDINDVRRTTEIPLKTFFDNYELIMRPANCYDDSNVVKLSLYNLYIAGDYHVEFAMDDDVKNIELWESLGINTILCGYGKTPQ